MKDRILREIRRLAIENGGIVPGKAAFAKATGIKPSTWEGRLWARWNDAVTDAGFEPNSMQKAYNSDEVMDHFAAVCRQLGKIPTTQELQLYVRQAADAPSRNTFIRHLGPTRNWPHILADWATEKGRGDILDIIPPESRVVPSNDDGDAAKEGYVYLVAWGPHFKIGRSDNVEQRFKQIQTALPYKAEIIHTIKTDDPSGVEAYWHRRFSDKRQNGEWFALNTADLRAFKRRTFQ